MRTRNRRFIDRSPTSQRRALARRRRADRYPTVIKSFDSLMEAAIEAVGSDPASVGKWVENLIRSRNDAGWIHNILKSLLSSDDYYQAKFISQLQPQIAKFLADEAAYVIYETAEGMDEEPHTVESYPGQRYPEDPYGPYGRIE